MAMSSKPNPKTRRGHEPVAPTALEGEINARNLIEVVEDYQRRLVVDQRDPAGFQPAAFRPAREQAEQLLFADQFKFPAHIPPLYHIGPDAARARRKGYSNGTFFAAGRSGVKRVFASAAAMSATLSDRAAYARRAASYHQRCCIG